MSLESGSFIKDLVASNPEGTDPKSQGDDHLRLLKAVLKSQFSGFTQGIPVTATEGMINAITGTGGSRQPRNVDGGAANIDFYGVVLGTTGTIPPGGNTGDFVLTFPWDGNRQYQLWFATTTQTIWFRVYNSPTWGQWQDYRPFGVGQSWQSFIGSRSFTTQYVNTTGRTIQVNVVAAAGQGAQTYMVGFVRGNIVARELISDGATPTWGTISLLVPPGHEYQINILSGSATVQEWMELR